MDGNLSLSYKGGVKPLLPAGPPGHPPTHPGELLKHDVFPALGIPMTTIAAELGISRANLYKLMDGEISLTPETALRLAKYLSGDPEFWLRLQAAYDLHQARQALEAAGALEAVPVRWKPADAA